MIVFDLNSEKPKATYSDYCKTPEGGKYQLIGGEIIEMPSPTPYHQKILQNLNFYISTFIRKNQLGDTYIAPCDVYFSETETYQPDLLVILNDNLYKVKETRIEGAPDFIAEVLSYSTGYFDIKYKKSVYEKLGVKEYWILDPKDKTIEIFENINQSFSLISELDITNKASSKLLEGFEIELKNIF